MPYASKTDTSTATRFIYDNIHKHIKIMGYAILLTERSSNSKQFNFLWKKGEPNHTDYFTKHHTTTHPRAKKSTYIKDTSNTT